MDRKEFEKKVCEYLKEKERLAKEKIYVLKNDTRKKLNDLEETFEKHSDIYKVSFDPLINAFDIHVEGDTYDWDRKTIKMLTASVDLMVMDVTVDDKVCIEMRILNACKELK